VAMTIAQGALLRPDLNGIDGLRTLAASVRMVICAVALAAVAYFAWIPLDAALGRSLPAQAAALAVACAAGLAVYAVGVLALRVPEAHQLVRLARERARGRG
jgi:uncharacterized membrane protein YidH (DUF202 family)